MARDEVPLKLSPKIERRALIVMGALCGLLTVACLAWAIAQAFDRPPDYAEACVLFNAARLREGLPLYVDPLRGAHEYGEPPARYFVAYTPFYAAVLAMVPGKLALVFGRLVGLFAWYGALARGLLTAPPRHWRVTAIATLFAASIFLFARWAVCAKPDAVAALLASIAFTRALDRGQADLRSGSLFAIAALVKPSIIGMAVGTLATCLLVCPKQSWRGLIAALAVLTLGLAVIHVASGGLGLAQMRAALGLVFDARVAMNNVLSRSPFIAGLVVVAALGAWQAKAAAAARLGLGGLVASILFVCVGFGKIGASSNYLMEPALASVLLISRFAPRLPRTRARLLACATSVVVTLAWASNATARSVVSETASFGAARQALARTRTRCVDRPGAMVMSPDPGIELALNGRLYTHIIELWNEVRLGRFPAEVWAADVRHSNVRCFVAWTGDAPPFPNPEGLFPPAVLDAMRDRFRPPIVDHGYAVYVAREP